MGVAILVTVGTSKVFVHLLIPFALKAIGIKKGAHGVIKEGVKEVVKEQAKDAIKAKDDKKKDDKKDE
jgi:hypothetical protein